MSNGYGIDLGTNNLKIYSKASQDVTNVKNTIALFDKGKTYAYGDDAYSMYEKAPDTIQVSFPISNGVISDFDNMQTILVQVLENVMKAHIKGSDIVIAVPTDITEVEKKAFNDIFSKKNSKIKVRSVSLCEKPLADALGMGLDITEPTGVMVVDLGADTTEISVISLGGLVLSNLLPFGGNKLDEDIVTHLKRKYNLLIGKKTAKELKEKIGSTEKGRGQTMEVVGRDVVAGLPISMTIDSDMVYEGMKDDLNSICSSIKVILEKVPPELAKDIVYQGIYLTGGSSQLDGITKLFNELTNIKMNVAENGEDTVAYGLGKVLTDAKFRKFGYTMKSRVFE
jgi:rod shape-determining protein MreB